MSRPIVGNFWPVACNLICWLFFAALVGGFLTFLHRKYCSVFVKAFEKAFWLPVRKRMSTFDWGDLFSGASCASIFLNFLFRVLRELSNLQKLRVYPTEQLYLLLNSNSLLFVPPPAPAHSVVWHSYLHSAIFEGQQKLFWFGPSAYSQPL